MGVVHPPLTPPSREGDSGVSCESYFFGDDVQNAFGVGENVVVPEADHAIAVGFDDFRSSGIGGAFSVLPTVEFDCDTQGTAGEVDDEVADLMLPGEFYAAKLLGAKARPQAFLGIGRVVAQVSREAGQSFHIQRRTPIPTLPQGEGLSIASRV